MVEQKDSSAVPFVARMVARFQLVPLLNSMPSDEFRADWSVNYAWLLLHLLLQPSISKVPELMPLVRPGRYAGNTIV